MFSHAYHNTTSRFNAYFVAKEDIKFIESDILQKHDWNYNLILPIFPQFDSTLSNSYQERIDHCITKASLAIQYHKGSKWEDDSYNLVGQARFYSLDYVNAIETFKYVNTKGKDDNAKHSALVNLMRTFIEYNELNNAEAVSDYLKNEKLNRKNLKNLYLTRGYLYQKIENQNYMVQNLIQAEPLMSNPKEKSRINFIIGQLYQSLSLDPEAYKHYKKALKGNPPYELSFYTKLNMAQVTQISENHNIKKIRKYFKKLLKDRKNEDFKDKIYYEMASFEIRNGNLDLGMDHYRLSIRSSKTNKRQKAHSYLALGKIYYDSLMDYRMAKLYYDSTMSVLPKDELEYESISSRQKILENFVEQLDIIHKNDSLLNLVALSSDSLNAFIDQYIAREEALENERRKEERRKRKIQAAAANAFFNNQQGAALGASNYEGNTWYFYSTSALDRGTALFRSIWGDRQLEDNWRLASKGPDLSDAEQSEESEENSQQEEQKVDIIDQEFKIDRAALIAGLPDTAEKQQSLLDEIEHATYKLGNIYNFDLEQLNNSTETFEKLLSRFPETAYRHEVMYQLYLLFTQLDNKDQMNYYKNLILSEAPESLYGKLIINPNYREDSRLESEKLQRIYAKAYKSYEVGQYDEAIAALNQGLKDYTDNDYIDNTELLKILVQAKARSSYRYEFELNNFLKKHPESELTEYVTSLISSSQNFQINLVNSSRAKFNTNLGQQHFFVFVYETDEQLASELPSFFEELLPSNQNLELGSLLLDKDYSILLISEFDNRSSALSFNALVNDQNPTEKINKTGKFYNFVITKENFDIFYQTKELDTYLKFFRKNYQVQ